MLNMFGDVNDLINNDSNQSSIVSNQNHKVLNTDKSEEIWNYFLN